MRRTTLLALSLAVASALLFMPGSAQAAKLRGVWDGPLGPVRLNQSGNRVVGTLVGRSKHCDLAKGARVIDGMMMAGNFSGKVRLCQTACTEEATSWAFAMLVRAGRQLSGAAALKVKAGCEVPGRSANGGVIFRKRRPPPKKRPRPSDPPLVTTEDPEGDEDPGGSGEHQMVGPEQEGYDPRAAASMREKAMNVARDGAAYLQEGRFEKARERFQEAVKIDPTYAEGYNGIGVTFALRRDWAESARWYQRSIGTNPDIGDAYYNLACAYAQMGKGDLAVRYLRIAVLNGYSEVAHLKEDGDLAPLRKRKDYQGVLKLGRLTAGASAQ